MCSRISHLNIFYLIPVLALLVIALPVQAQDGNGFSEGFDDPTLPGWEHSQDVWVSGGILTINPANFAFRMGLWAEPAISVSIRFPQPASLMIHYHASDNGSYGVQLLSSPQGLEVILIQEHGGTRTELGRTELGSFLLGEWNSVEISLAAGQHQVTINDQVLLTLDDDAPLNPGSIGFVANGDNPVEIDDLLVKASPASPPAPGSVEAQPPGETPFTADTSLPPASMQTTPLVTPQPGTGARSLLEELFVSGASPLDLQTFIINLSLAALLAFMLGLVYIHWGASLSNRRKFAANFILITITTTFIIMVVRSSVALSLGLVGALSIVRFRAAIKEPEELAFLFLAIGLGIGLGDNQRLITILAFSAAIILLGLMRLFRRSNADVNLHLNIISSPPAQLDLLQVQNALQPNCAKLKLLRFDENEKGLDISFLVEFRKMEDLNAARRALLDLSRSLSITFLDNKGLW